MKENYYNFLAVLSLRSSERLMSNSALNVEAYYSTHWTCSIKHRLVDMMHELLSAIEPAKLFLWCQSEAVLLVFQRNTYEIISVPISHFRRFLTAKNLLRQFTGTAFPKFLKHVWRTNHLAQIPKICALHYFTKQGDRETTESVLIPTVLHMRLENGSVYSIDFMKRMYYVFKL